MTNTAKVASQSGGNRDLFWKIVYFVGLFSICLGFYVATEQADYIWRWNRLPRYFYYVDTIDVNAEIEGEVSSISHKDGESVVIIQGDGSRNTTQFPAPTFALVKATSSTWVIPSVYTKKGERASW